MCRETSLSRGVVSHYCCRRGMREWLPEDGLVFVVLNAVAAADLGEFGGTGLTGTGGPSTADAALVNLRVEIGVNPDSHPWADAQDGCCAAR